MRGPAAPTSPGAWDARSEALLAAPALTPPPTDPPAGDAEAAPTGIAPAAPPTAPVTAPAPGTAWGGAPEAAGRAAAARFRRGAGDPVKVLMHRHRELCERAVDPLEIAAGLEAEGFTDRSAARFRHRDVFSLAEELYARVPRGRETATAPVPEPPARTPWALAALAPGAVAALAGLGLALTDGTARLLTGAGGALGLAAALLLAVRRGPLRAPDGHTVPATALWTLWLLAYAVAGDGFLAQVLVGGPDGAWPLTPAPLLGLALAVAPAAWCAHLFASRARRRITDSRGLADFAAATRPLLLGTVALHLLALGTLLAVTRFTPGAFALGALLLLARLLTVHGYAETAASALAAASAAEALAPASVLISRLPLPNFDALAAPVRTAVETWDPQAVPTLVCGAAALGLLAHATGALTRASAHVSD